MEEKSSDYIKTANILGYAFSNLSKFEDARAIFNESMNLAEEINDKELAAQTLYYQASLEWFRTNFEKGFEIATDLLNFSEKNKLFIQSAYCASLLGSFYLQRNELREAEKYLDLAIEGFKKIKHISALCTAIVNKALLSLRRGEYLAAKTASEEVLIKSQQTDNRTLQYIILANLASIDKDLGRFDEAIRLSEKALEINPDFADYNYVIATVLYRKDELTKVKTMLEEKIKVKEEIYYCIGLAMVYNALGRVAHGEDFLNKGLNQIEVQKPNIETEVEAFLIATQFYYENSDFAKSLEFAKKIIRITNSLSREYNLASAFMKINSFNLKQIDKLAITQETHRLKEIGCIYDYAYLKRLVIESKINTGLDAGEIKDIAEELSNN